MLVFQCKGSFFEIKSKLTIYTTILYEKLNFSHDHFSFSLSSDESFKKIKQLTPISIADVQET